MTDSIKLVTGLSLVILLLSSFAHAAVPKETRVAPNKILQKDAATFGGVAGSGFTLLDVRRTADIKKKIERIVLDVGDINGSKIKGQPGYFYAEMKTRPHRLVVDFSQMPNASIDEKRLREVMKKSLAVKNVNMNVDPVDSSLSLSLDLKAKTKALVYPVNGAKATSKVVIDLISE